MLLKTILLLLAVSQSQSFNTCLNNPCKNGARCLPIATNYCPVTCLCSEKFTGLYCERPISIIIGHLNPYMIEHQSQHQIIHPIAVPFHFGCPFSCRNGGTCSSTTLKCVCLTGWSGNSCEKKETVVIIGQNQVDFHVRHDLCNPNPCRNDGKCITTDFGTFRCICRYNWIGITCERQPEEPVIIPETTTTTTTTTTPARPIIIEHKTVCFINPCRNGGTCISYTFSSYKCSCQYGWSGNACERRSQLITVEDVHPVAIQSIQLRRRSCSDNPCQHGGICQSSLFYGFRCSCSSGWTGLSCERQDRLVIVQNEHQYHDIVHHSIGICEHNPCRNGGSCISQPQGIYGYTCLCPPRIGGFICERYY